MGFADQHGRITKERSEREACCNKETFERGIGETRVRKPELRSLDVAFVLRKLCLMTRKC